DIGDILKRMRFDGLTERRAAPYTVIEENECELLEEHIHLICSIYNSNVRAKKDNYTLLMSSTVNVLYKAVTDKMRGPQRVRVSSADSARAKSVFTEFMNLAVTHFEKERGIAFYANEMCLTPKYLSKLVKESCGRTASEIIDSMVIAKTNNLLRHSDKSVKVIASEMGFSSQSAFNKFFKAKTGMSPLQYRSE
ncbi:MAG: helix-turn-helix domain-containing protein, partial [Bacteroidales bacterium]|nr:helix-turn-helix domain-containing protein [Bacteroidales bacterium]